MRILLLFLALAITSCCPKITESSRTTTSTDTSRSFHSQIVTIHDTVERSTSIDIDSLLAILNAPAAEHPDSVLSKTSTKGVTTKLVRRGNKILCEATIDSLQARIDSLETLTIHHNVERIDTKVIHQCDSQWHRFYRRFFFGTLILLVIIISWRGVGKGATLWVIAALLLQSCVVPAQSSMKLYTVPVGGTYAEPSIARYAGDTVQFWFKLTPDWAQLYNSSDNSTHKICGARDFLGRNSLRLGVRRAPTQRNGLIAVPYSHQDSKVDYTAFKGADGKTVLLQYDTTYFCRINSVKGGWKIELFNTRMQLLCTATKPISLSSTGRIVSGTYIEVGDKPSPWTIRTWIELK